VGKTGVGSCPVACFVTNNIELCGLLPSSLRACDADGRGKNCTYGFAGETRGKENTWKTCV